MPESPPVLDVRPADQFEQVHRAGAVNIPLEELPHRTHELPPRGVSLIVYDHDPARAEEARARLAETDRANVRVISTPEWLTEGQTETGPSTTRLWRPHALLKEAVDIARSTWPNLHSRRALDLACGSGRDAVYLALRGFNVEAWDILPDALARCDALAQRNAVRVTTRVRDIVVAPVSGADGVIPSNSFDLICVFNFLHRPLMSALFHAVRAGGLLVYETFLLEQRDRFGKPRRDAHLLLPNELAAFVPAGWTTLVYREGQAGERRIAASLIANRTR